MKRVTKHLLVIALPVLVAACGPKYKETEKEGYKLVENTNGATLGYAPESGIQILTVDRYAFKDLNKNGTLDPYEDWRLTAEERAKDLASKMSVNRSRGSCCTVPINPYRVVATVFLVL